MKAMSYYDVAENDRKYLEQDLEAGRVGNILCANVQNCCEKYLKHMISEFYDPDDPALQNEKTQVLRTHSIRRLLKFIRSSMSIDIGKDEVDSILKADGYYFSARHPGDEYFETDEDDSERCREALQCCKKFTDRVIAEKSMI